MKLLEQRVGTQNRIMQSKGETTLNLVTATVQGAADSILLYTIKGQMTSIHKCPQPVRMCLHPSINLYKWPQLLLNLSTYPTHPCSPRSARVVREQTYMYRGARFLSKALHSTQHTGHWHNSTNKQTNKMHTVPNLMMHAITNRVVGLDWRQKVTGNHLRACTSTPSKQP